MGIRNVIAVGVLAGLTLAACSSGGGGSPDTAAKPDTVALAVAAQIRPVADKLAAAYKTANPGKTVNVVDSDPTQIGAAISDKSVDVVAVPSGFLGTTPPTGTLGTNRLVIAVPAANPGNVAGLSAFNDRGNLRTTVCGTPTPLGDFTLAILRKAKVTPRASTISTSPDCPAKAMAALAGGQLDAAAMFRNNVVVPASAKTIAVPDEDNFVVPIDYAVVRDRADSAAFRTFLASDQVRTILTENGYLP
jgi:ABC-type molybdate transport system substrate-binding protein